MELALEDAGLDAADIAHINAHGTSTPLNDAAEAEAIAKVFGAPGPPVTSIKGVTGHALGAAGAIEAVAVVLSIQNAADPADRGLRARPTPTLAPIDLVHGAARAWTPGPGHLEHLRLRRPQRLRQSSRRRPADPAGRPRLAGSARLRQRQREGRVPGRPTPAACWAK